MSHVAMGQHICMVCGVKHESGEILLSTRFIGNKLRDIPEEARVTGWGLCPEHKKLEAEYVALIECKNQPTKLEDADRTGQVAHIRRSVFGQVFGGAACPPGPVAFVEAGVIDKLRSMMAPEGGS